MAKNIYSIKFNKAEVLVMYSLLDRYVQNESFSFEDQSEERVLSDMLCKIQEQLEEQFAPDLEQLIADARKTVREAD